MAEITEPSEWNGLFNFSKYDIVEFWEEPGNIPDGQYEEEFTKQAAWAWEEFKEEDRFKVVLDNLIKQCISDSKLSSVKGKSSSIKDGGDFLTRAYDLDPDKRPTLQQIYQSFSDYK